MQIHRGPHIEDVPPHALHDSLDAARERIEAQRAKLRQEIQRAQAKLGNQGFVTKAPPQVVDGEREKLARLQAELESL